MLPFSLMGRRAKLGHRTKSGRLSRAYQGPARDVGTDEFQAKRAALINGSDPQLAASASGILLANEMISPEQHHAVLSYAWCHAMLYGRPWRQACPLGERTGDEAPDELVELAKEKLAAMDGLLTLEQRHALANVAVFGFVPQWFFTERLRLRGLPGDQAERAALVSGLDRLAGSTAPARSPRRGEA
jgi:hypothetical protein